MFQLCRCAAFRERCRNPGPNDTFLKNLRSANVTAAVTRDGGGTERSARWITRSCRLRRPLLEQRCVDDVQLWGLQDLGELRVLEAERMRLLRRETRDPVNTGRRFCWNAAKPSR